MAQSDAGAIISAALASHPVSRRHRAEVTASHPPLSARERRVITLHLDGFGGTAEIAGHLGISPRTVDNTFLRAYQKLGINSRRELTRDHLGPADSEDTPT
jgi:DNA-binding CsgD family transcriptional regulator